MITVINLTSSMAFGIRRFSVAFTKTLHWSLSSTNWIQFILSIPPPVRSIKLLSSPCIQAFLVGSYSWSFQSTFLNYSYSFHLNLLDLITVTILGELYHSWSFLLFSISITLGLNIHLTFSFQRIFGQYFPLKVSYFWIAREWFFIPQYHHVHYVFPYT